MQRTNQKILKIERLARVNSLLEKLMHFRRRSI